jgi:glycosyltransferase involved in cell wall biosynthesis
VRVAVIIPTHRRAHLLVQALQSVLAQTRPPDEIIVVDDADDPESRDVVQHMAWSNPHLVRYVLNETGTGASSSRNCGVEHASSDIIALLDDDDTWEPTYLERAVERLESSGVDAVLTWLYEIRSGRTLPVRSPREGLTASDALAVNPGAGGSNICIQRAVYRRLGGFDDTLWVSNDKDFFLRLLQSGGRYAVVRERLVRVRHDAGQRLTDTDARRLAGMRQYYAKHREACLPVHHRELRRQIHRAELRVCRDHEQRRWLQHLYTVGLVVLARPRKLPTRQRLRQLLVPPRQPHATPAVVSQKQRS